MDKTKKISYQSLKEKLSDNQLKRIIAGSGGAGNSTCEVYDIPSGEHLGAITCTGVSASACKAHCIYACQHEQNYSCTCCCCK